MDQARMMLAMGGFTEEGEETTNMMDTNHCCEMSRSNVCSS